MHIFIEDKIRIKKEAFIASFIKKYHYVEAFRTFAILQCAA